MIWKGSCISRSLSKIWATTNYALQSWLHECYILKKKEPHSPRDREMIGNHNPLNLSLQNMLLLQLICFVMCRCIENIPLFKKKKVAFYLVHDRLSKFKLEKLFLLSFWLHLSLQLSGIKRKLMVMGHQDLNAWWQIDGKKVQFEW